MAWITVCRAGTGTNFPSPSARQLSAIRFSGLKIKVKKLGIEYSAGIQFAGIDRSTIMWADFQEDDPPLRKENDPPRLRRIIVIEEQLEFLATQIFKLKFENNRLRRENNWLLSHVDLLRGHVESLNQWKSAICSVLPIRDTVLKVDLSSVVDPLQRILANPPVPAKRINWQAVGTFIALFGLFVTATSLFVTAISVVLSHPQDFYRLLDFLSLIGNWLLSLVASWLFWQAVSRSVSIRSKKFAHFSTGLTQLREATT